MVLLFLTKQATKFRFASPSRANISAIKPSYYSQPRELHSFKKSYLNKSFSVMSSVKKSWKEFTKDELDAIEKKRETVKAKNEPKDPKATYKKMCPACDKPNAVEVTFCTGCSFGITEWDLKRVSDNIFLDMINGIDTGTNVLHRTDKFLVFDDKFGVSDNHLDVIPTAVISDIAALTKEHIPMLEDLYRLGLEEMKRRLNAKSNKAIQLYEKRDLEDYIVAGYNYPVSVKHLHLHIVLPPFTHEKVFQYPRWHSHNKVLNDLKSHGRVIPYAEKPNDDEGLGVYNKAIKQHRETSEALKSL